MGFLVDFWNAVPTVLFFLVGLQLILLWLCSFFQLRLLFARLSWIAYISNHLSDFVILPVLLGIFLLLMLRLFYSLFVGYSFWRQSSQVKRDFFSSILLEYTFLPPPTKFSYSSFGVPSSASNLFLNSNAYLSLISVGPSHSAWSWLYVWRFFLGLIVWP